LASFQKLASLTSWASSCGGQGELFTFIIGRTVTICTESFTHTGQVGDVAAGFLKTNPDDGAGHPLFKFVQGEQNFSNFIWNGILDVGGNTGCVGSNEFFGHGNLRLPGQKHLSASGGVFLNPQEVGQKPLLPIEIGGLTALNIFWKRAASVGQFLD
jgi:hypothetical protein